MSRPLFIYVLVDPRSSECRYVGKASDPGSRLRAHLCEARGLHRRNRRTCWLRSLINAGVAPVMKIIRRVTRDRWEFEEMDAIASYRAAGKDLTNSTDGGEGQTPGYAPSAETRKKLSAINRGRTYTADQRARMSAAQRLSRPNLGRKFPIEVREKISAAQRGRKLPQAWCDAISKGRTGQRYSMEMRERLSAIHKERWRIIREKRKTNEATNN